MIPILQEREYLIGVIDRTKKEIDLINSLPTDSDLLVNINEILDKLREKLNISLKKYREYLDKCE